MKKIWLIASTTYRQRVRSASFLLLTFALPGLMVIAGSIPILSAQNNQLPAQVGIVDQTGQLGPVKSVQVDEDVLHLKAFDSPEAAQSAYQQKEIAGYLVVPADYFSGAATRYYTEKAPDDLLNEALRRYMRRALLPTAPDWALERLSAAPNRTFVALASGQSVMDGPGRLLQFAAPGLLSVFMSLALLFTATQMGMAMVREKDQRAMEMVITSVRPSQLVAGKVLGVSLLSLTQVAVWGLGAVIGLGLYFSSQVELTGFAVPWNALLWAVLLGVPGYFLFAVVAAGLGIIAGDNQQAQQLAGFLGFFAMAPLWLAAVIVDAPNGQTAIGLSLFPLTGPAVALLRMALTDVPVGQLFASLGILLVTLVVAVWLVTRIFEAAMLLYGQSLRPRDVLRVLRQV